MKAQLKGSKPQTPRSSEGSASDLPFPCSEVRPPRIPCILDDDDDADRDADKDQGDDDEDDDDDDAADDDSDDAVVPGDRCSNSSSYHIPRYNEDHIVVIPTAIPTPLQVCHRSSSSSSSSSSNSSSSSRLRGGSGGGGGGGGGCRGVRRSSSSRRRRFNRSRRRGDDRGPEVVRGVLPRIQDGTSKHNHDQKRHYNADES